MLDQAPGNTPIEAQSSVYDIIIACHPTVDVFHEYNDIVGECISCTSLFLTLDEVSEKYSLNLEELLNRLREAAGQG